MADPLREFLHQRSVLLADGGMGTSLFRLGLVSGDNPELWNVEQAEKVASVHQSFVEAGSDIILTNTFGGNHYRLKLHRHEDRVAELNRAGAALARAVADAAGRRVLVGGSMGPTGEIFRPVGTLDPLDGEAAFAAQAEALAEGGVDVLWIETISAAEELAAALQAAARTGLPVVSTMSFDTNGRTMMGLTPDAALELAHAMPVRPVAFGANCGIGPADLVATILGFRNRAEPDEILIAKANCGVPVFRDGQIHYSGTPEVMAAYARLARDAGARIVGGCCGTDASHLRAMRAALDGSEPGGVPDVAAIEAALGRVSVAAGEGRERGERRRRRS
ncbi:MAG TPA: betaine--homocysteine S-methyltransferase [Geminicoccaceae bacterium]|nr:betaine--homocysteine S-methyltransferase [Geminicoccaceae bacterium]